MSKIFPLDEESFDLVEAQGWDYYGLLDEAETLFARCGVRLRDEEPFTAWVSASGVLLGALWAYEKEGDFEGCSVFRFSVVVEPDVRRRGIARALVQDFEARSGADMLEAWVINPHMAKLLEGMDFDGDWSQDNPMMEKFA